MNDTDNKPQVFYVLPGSTEFKPFSCAVVENAPLFEYDSAEVESTDAKLLRELGNFSFSCTADKVREKLLNYFRVRMRLPRKLKKAAKKHGCVFCRKTYELTYKRSFALQDCKTKWERKAFWWIKVEVRKHG